MNVYRVVCEGTGARPHPRRDVATLRVGREWEAAESWAVGLLQRAGFDDAEARDRDELNVVVPVTERYAALEIQM